MARCVAAVFSMLSSRSWGLVGTHGGACVLLLDAAAAPTRFCISQIPTYLVTGKLIYFIWPRFRFGGIPKYKREHMRTESLTQIVDDLFK
jgi:hypothetical protein